MKLLTLFVLLFIVGNSGFASEAVVSGFLKGGMMAIGGETTGYFLQTDNKRLEVSLPEGVIKNFQKWNGKNVSLIGKTLIVKSLERGERKVFMVSSLSLNGKKGIVREKVQKSKVTKNGFVSKFLKYIGIN